MYRKREWERGRHTDRQTDGQTKTETKIEVEAGAYAERDLKEKYTEREIESN